MTIKSPVMNEDIKINSGVNASDLLKKIDEHDEPIIQLLQERPCGFTLIQIANRLKRSRNDVKYSIHRLKLGGHVKNWPWYGRVCLVEFDFRKQVYAAHPEDAITKIDALEETIKQQQAAIDELKIAAEHTIGWVESTGGDIESIRMLDMALSKLKDNEE